MKGLHCPTCHCGDVNPPLRIDTAAPFYPLVVEADRLVWAHTLAARPDLERDAAGRWQGAE